MPASRSARAMTLAPRSCPSSPGLAIRTRILGAVESMALPQPQRYEEHKGRHEGAWSEHGGFFIFPPDLAQRVAHLAERGVRAGRPDPTRSWSRVAFSASTRADCSCATVSSM